MAVLKPLRVVIDNYPEDQVEELEAVNNPEDPSAGTRKVPFSKVLYIEQDDFRETPPPKYFRLSPGKEVRLRYAYFITCQSVVKDPQTGEVTEVHCTYDPATRGGDAPDGRKVKSTLHWVSARTPSMPRCGCTIGCSPRSFRTARRTSSTRSTPLTRGAAGLQDRAIAGDRAAGRPGAVRAPGLLLRRSEALEARRARLQPHRRAEGHLGKDREAGRMKSVEC